MNRRQMMVATGLAGLAPAISPLASQAAGHANKQYLELRKYRVLPEKLAPLTEFIGNVAVPAWNRAGIEPVGVFEPLEMAEETEAPEEAAVYVLLPHKSLESVASLEAALVADTEYQTAGAAILDTPKKEPAFLRIESSLMAAFDAMPQVEVPLKADSRIFELRIYESHSQKFGHKKVEMFNKGGEIAIFRKTGLLPVFFGQNITGTLLPNLSYMIAFEDMEAHDANWEVFKQSPEWKALSGKPEYKGTVSHITKIFMRPGNGSQI